MLVLYYFLNLRVFHKAFKEPEDLIGVIDAAVVTHVHGKYHLQAAKPLLEAGMPLFIDKPFCCSRSGAKRFLARAAQLGVPICSFSVMPLQSSFLDLKKQVRKLGEIYAVVSTGPCDIKSKHGGIFFYGIHQVEMILELVGREVSHAQIGKGTGKHHVATLAFKDGKLATMNLIGKEAAFHLSVIGQKGRIDRRIDPDESMFLPGVRSFVRVFRTGKTDQTAETLLAPLAVLEALEKSIARKGQGQSLPLKGQSLPPNVNHG